MKIYLPATKEKKKPFIKCPLYIIYNTKLFTPYLTFGTNKSVRRYYFSQVRNERIYHSD